MPALNALKIVKKYFPNVKKVTEGKRPIRVKVERQDAKGAIRCDPTSCVMAKACVRALDVDGALISRNIAYIVKDEVATRYVVPPSVLREIVVFDRFGPKGFVPGDYSLARPSKSHTLASQRASRAESDATVRRAKQIAKAEGTEVRRPYKRTRAHQTAGIRGFLH